MRAIVLGTAGGRRVLAALAVVAGAAGAARADDAPASAPPAAASPATARADAGDAGPAPTRLGAAECLARAGKGDRVIAALHGVDIAKAREAEATAARLPVIDVTSIFSVIPERRGDPVSSTTPDSALFGENITEYGPFSATDATLTLPLSYWKLLPVKRAAHGLVTVAEGDVERTRGAVYVDTAKAYYGVLLLGDLIAVIDDGRDKVTSALKAIDTGLSSGTGGFTPLDKLKIEAFRGELEGRYHRATAARATAVSALTMLVGAAPGERVEPAEDYLAPLEAALPPLADFLARAEHERPELKMLAAGIDARESALSLERAGLAPDVGLGGYFAFHWSPVAKDQDSPFAYDPYNHLRGGIGIGLKWTLDVGAKLARIDRAKAELEKLRAESDAAHAAIRLEVEKDYRDVEAALAAVTATDAGLKSAGKWLFTAASAFGIGTAESRELLEALLMQGTLSLSNLQALYDYNVGLVALEVAVGGDAAARLASLGASK
ncbi:MAG TPA: TolC family protein [Myxococcota bacterium]|nr:TolC family protein [Myxococcota bacterium]